MVKTHYQQGTNIVKRPACSPLAYDSYEWDMTTNKNKVNCKKCIKFLNNFR